jgi:predicted nuclease with TOPRIM domain
VAEQQLQAILRDARKRLLGVSLGGGLGWALVAATLLLVLCAWLDLASELPAAVRLACLLASVALGLTLLAWAAAVAVRHARGPALARQLDRAGATGGQILAGVDLARQYLLPAAPGGLGGGAVVAQGNMSAALARMAVERASRLAGDVGAAAAVPLRPLFWPAVLLSTVAAALMTLALAAPRLAGTQWARFTDPFGDHPPYSPIEFDVTPGDAKVLYGSALDVRATPKGGAVEQLDLVLLPAEAGTASGEGSAGTAAEHVLPMFPEPSGSWRASVAEVTASGRYLVRTRGARSGKFAYDVVTVPEIRDVRFRVTPPAYTHRPPYEGPLPQGGLAGLPGTTVEAWVKSNRPMSGGTARFVPSADAAAAVPVVADAGKSGAGKSDAGKPVTARPAAMALAPTGPNAAEAWLLFTIDRPGKIEFGLTDVAGQASRGVYSAPVHLLRDDRPFVRVMEPRPQSYATPDVTLEVSVLAEDDYGVSRVQVFRSLNDSRPRPTEAAVPPAQPRRVPASVPLKLADYGLKPGDTIRVFARVEDNDPAGPKGTESPVVTVRIISKEDLNRMTMARQGLETLQSKYEQARRRLEALDHEIRKQQEELAKLPPDAEVSKEGQKALEDLAKQVEQAADDIAAAAGEDLPLDLDRKLRQSLYDLAADVRKAGGVFGHDAGQLGLSASAAKKAADQLRKDLGLEREQFEKEATDPIEHLAKIFPLKEDEARFADLAVRQRDLADRMSALKGEAGDDPKLKARLRDLEQEQRQLREELRDLLQDVDDHVQALPSDPKLDGLRQAAEAFAKAVRESDAAQQMNASETSLSEFKGGDAAARAKQAADTLEKFLSKCKGMGEQAGECLRFQPKLSEGLGDTVEQLLQMEGLGNGSKPGKGMGGGGGGYSARRNTLRNVGLYGSRPRMSKASQSKGGRGDPGANVRAGGQAPDAEAPTATESGGRVKSAGESDVAVPSRYKRKVGEYFQRVADELGD